MGGVVSSSMWAGTCEAIQSDSAAKMDCIHGATPQDEPTKVVAPQVVEVVAPVSIVEQAQATFKSSGEFS